MRVKATADRRTGRRAGALGKRLHVLHHHSVHDRLPTWTYTYLQRARSTANVHMPTCTTVPPLQRL